MLIDRQVAGSRRHRDVAERGGLAADRRAAHDAGPRQRRGRVVHDALGAVEDDVGHFVVGLRATDDERAGVRHRECARRCLATSQYAGARCAVLQAARQHRHVSVHVHATARYQHEIAGTCRTDGLGRSDHVAGDQRRQLAGVVYRYGCVDVQVTRCTDGDVALRSQHAVRFDVDIAVAEHHEVAGAGRDLDCAIAHQCAVAESRRCRVGEDVQVGGIALCIAWACGRVGRSRVDAQVTGVGRQRARAVADVPSVAASRVAARAGCQLVQGRRSGLRPVERVELARQVERRVGAGNWVAVVIGSQSGIDGSVARQCACRPGSRDGLVR